MTNHKTRLERQYNRARWYWHPFIWFAAGAVFASLTILFFTLLWG